MKHTDTLSALLAASGDYALHCRDTSNHCPMALIALAKLGASDMQLRHFFETWTQRHALPDESADGDLPGGDWQAARGQNERFGQLRRYFAAELALHGSRQLIGTVLDAWTPAPASGAFHAFIRTAYGVAYQHNAEIAAGLAAYVCGYTPIDVPMQNTSPPIDVFAGFARLSSVPRPQGHWISQRLRTVAAEPTFARTLPPVPLTGDLPLALMRAAAAAYAASGNFTILHLMTGSYAASILRPLLPSAQQARLDDAMWRAACAGWVAAGTPLPPVEPPETPPIDWHTLTSAAIQTADDHVVKLTYVCRQMAARDTQGLYAQAVLRALAGHALSASPPRADDGRSATSTSPTITAGCQLTPAPAMTRRSDEGLHSPDIALAGIPTSDSAPSPHKT
ncbi:questin oxidase family protein [Paludibacterium purpuratum]|uniref:Uncharacterized protein DUF4243 n=1 Tax=Paludibacterium purpuratum TaxID=1144873 RepID=A0A4R7B529_9NEIS|nr:questin oxidase family protein [Paludibacterium purpuratum]TDR79701.1 uncharacterized protein DUF4243 [Paludibacterium purpuratum]